MDDAAADPASEDCPPSATHGLVAFGGLLGLVGGVVLLRVLHPFQNVAYSGLVVMACVAVGIFGPDLFWQKVQWRALTPEARPGDWGRVWTKFAGLLLSVGVIASLYWLFPEYYRNEAFYRNYWSMLRIVLPVWLVLAVPYLFWVDCHMPEPHDAYWQAGCLVTLRWRDVRPAVLGQHLLGWLVKGFFLPLMFVYMCGDLAPLLAYDAASVTRSFKAFYDCSYLALYFVDVGLTSVTYLVSLRLTDTHVRSAEPTLLGWLLALVCYQPFYSFISSQYLDYESVGRPWEAWIGGHPYLYAFWGGMILASLLIYVWATVAFGGRFSNLTHRGIITNGPYRYTKHPAYVSKNISWWLISMPFMISASVPQSIRQCLMLLALNGVYYLRAKTEERHLSLDPTYRHYAAWMSEHGALRVLNRVPFVRQLTAWRLEFGKRPLDWVWPRGGR
jgi:hypothetical protein